MRTQQIATQQIKSLHDSDQLTTHHTFRLFSYLLVTLWPEDLGSHSKEFSTSQFQQAEDVLVSRSSAERANGRTDEVMLQQQQQQQQQPILCRAMNFYFFPQPTHDLLASELIKASLSSSAVTSSFPSIPLVVPGVAAILFWYLFRSLSSIHRG